MLEEAGDDDAPAEDGPPMSQAAMRDSIDAWIARNVAEDRFSGVVQLVDGDRTVYERAAGIAERRFGTPVTLETRFNIGSITKLFTKIAIARLMSEGKIAPGDKLSKHLPDYPKAVADRVTIGQLLEHRSGLGDIFGPEYDAIEKSNLRDLADFVPLFKDKPLRFEPGTDQYYSNAGYTVLGLVIERLSGMPYHDYIHRVVYEPAGMIASGPTMADQPTPNLATGYTRSPRRRDWSREDEERSGRHHGHDEPADRSWELRANTYRLPGLSGSAGGGYSSAADLDRFARAFRHDRLLPPAYTQWVLGGALPARDAKKKSKPSMESFPAGAAVGLGGGAEGINAVLEMYLDREMTLVVLANMDPPIAEQFARKIRGWMRRAGLVKGG
jgi:CubicO group peptidase (beta-lactamase class C family)